MTALCEARGVTRHFGALRAVDDVDVDFEPGRLYGLIGPNGAGKSTLVSLLSGELPVDRGQITFAGRPITGLSPDQRAMLGIGRTFQRTRLPRAMTVFDTVLVGCLTVERAGTLGYLVRRPATVSRYRAARRNAVALVEELDLEEWADTLVRDTPFVAQRRLELARALSTRPRLLLLDEPTAGMSRESLPPVSDMLRRLCQRGVTVLVIEHNVPFIRLTAEELLAMDSGRLIARGDPASVLADPAVIASYVGRPPREDRA